MGVPYDASRWRVEFIIDVAFPVKELEGAPIAEMQKALTVQLEETITGFLDRNRVLRYVGTSGVQDDDCEGPPDMADLHWHR